MKEAAPQAEHNKNMHDYSRRRFLRGAAHAVTLASLMGVAGKSLDMGYDALRADTTFSLEKISDPSAERLHPHTAWVMVPGFNMAWKDSREMAEALQPGFSPYAQTFWLGYQNSDFSPRNMICKTIDNLHTNKITATYLYGHSFGGMLALELANALVEDGIRVPGIILDSTPSSYKHVQVPEPILRAVAGGALTNGVRMVAETASIHQMDFKASLQATTAATNATRASNELLRESAAYIMQFLPHNLATTNLYNTDIAYIGSTNDEFVNTSYSRNAWSESLHKAKTFNFYDSSPASHASPRGDTSIYLATIEKFMNRYDPPVLRRPLDWRMH
ncbi:alpha/beta fold hydrolase [Candidatus Saccharibacteria bacterium]|nr:alpha/beta fold hydrolase [Candidatus Saccharibacteria bacterium]